MKVLQAHNLVAMGFNKSEIESFSNLFPKGLTLDLQTVKNVKSKISCSSLSKFANFVIANIELSKKEKVLAKINSRALEIINTDLESVCNEYASLGTRINKDSGYTLYKAKTITEQCKKGVFNSGCAQFNHILLEETAPYFNKRDLKSVWDKIFDDPKNAVNQIIKNLLNSDEQKIAQALIYISQLEK